MTESGKRRGWARKGCLGGGLLAGGGALPFGLATFKLEPGAEGEPFRVEADHDRTRFELPR